MKDIDLTKTLADADEHDLLIRLGQLWGERERSGMTRSVATECHHQILYAIGAMKDIEVRIAADMVRGRETDWNLVIEAAMKAINDLSALAVFARTGKGGGSYLNDRNAQVVAESEIPWGKPARVEIPVEFGSDDYLRGIRSRTYIGHICSHSDPSESLVCVEPPSHQVVLDPPKTCIPFDPEKATITVLEGKLADWEIPYN